MLNISFYTVIGDLKAICNADSK